MSLVRSLVILFLALCITGVQSVKAQIPTSEPLTLAQALGNAKRDFNEQWGALKTDIVKRHNAQFGQLKTQYIQNVKSVGDKAQHARLREQYDAQIKVMREANRVELEKAYADSLDTYKYNVEQVKKSYGVL